MRLTAREILILKELRKNSRSSLVELSDATGYPMSTIFYKLKKLNCLIDKHTSLINFDSLNYLKVNFILNSKNNIKDFLTENKNLNNASKITNGYLVQGVFKNLKEVDSFIEELANLDIEVIERHDIIETIQQEEFLVKKIDFE
ncbi:MAG: Lrp/AsnC family transcriptional regulator [Candidatus Nanoarchaeia archaeon]|nr:Lrp/AsnC family transcriptional regulator [Candidatus Nanoarchaeia archaeon]